VSFGNAGQTLGAVGNSLTLQKNATTVAAPTGPGAGMGVSIVARPSPTIPGYCRLVVIAGNSFGVEFPLTMAHPSYPQPNTSIPSNTMLEITDFPGGPNGC
jgi:hypothetical protein